MLPETVKHIAKVFGMGITLLPQNMQRNSVPAKLLKSAELGKEHLAWIRRDKSYLGLIISKKALENKAIHEWVQGRVARHGSGVVEGPTYWIFIEAKVS